jgi:hypoxanthine phosphoribosyltransferase
LTGSNHYGKGLVFHVRVTLPERRFFRRRVAEAPGTTSEGRRAEVSLRLGAGSPANRVGDDGPVNVEKTPAEGLTVDHDPAREVLTYETFGTGVRELAQTIADSGFVPDILLGIARGGLIPAGALAYALEAKNLFTISVEFYTGVNARLDVPVMLPPFLDAHDLDDATVLIVDDVADTGRTLELVHRFCEGHVAHARTAVLYEKPQSVIKADYVWRRTDRWIDFPWSSQPPVRSLRDQP